MALDALLGLLESEAESTKRGILDEARARADAIRAEARAHEEHQRTASRRSTESSARTDAAARLARIRQEAETEILAARRGLIERVFEEARKRLPARLDATTLQRHLDEALALAGTEHSELICRPELESAVRAVAGVQATVRVDDDAGWGIRIWIESSRLDLDNTIEARLERLEPWLALELVRRAENHDRLD